MERLMKMRSRFISILLDIKHLTQVLFLGQDLAGKHQKILHDPCEICTEKKNRKKWCRNFRQDLTRNQILSRVKKSRFIKKFTCETPNVPTQLIRQHK
jgi:hypothetical protein